MQKSILITGCSSGIGLDCAETLHAMGWKVFASCRKQADCDRLEAMGITSPRLDHADADTIRDTIEQVKQATGGTLDAVFNNGAFAVPGAVEDLPTDALRAIYETNVFGYHEVIRQGPAHHAGARPWADSQLFVGLGLYHPALSRRI
jgi:NAD(P)-dependent dehydrogenase (short-subunit alcohol dehydrogenase family)